MPRQRVAKPALIGLLVLILTACGGAAQRATLPPPTATATPISTPLPPVATTAPYGSESRPYRFIVVPDVNSDASGRPLESYLVEETGRTFTVETFSQGEALAALCGGIPAAGLVDGWTLVAAQARGCAIPALRYQQTRGGAQVRGLRADVMVSVELPVATVADLRGQAFCRLSAQDDITWVLPALMMRQSGLDPLRDLSNVREVPNLSTLVREVVYGQCAGAIPSGTLAAYPVIGIRDVGNTVRSLGTSPELPLGGLVIDARIPSDVAEQLIRLVTANPESVRDLVRATTFSPLTAADIEQVTALFQAGAPLSR